MTKTKLHKEILRLCKEHNAPEPLIEALDELTRPRPAGGASVSSYTCFDEDGSPQYIFCTYHKKWEPVELFERNEKSKNGYERVCIVGVQASKDALNTFNATKRAIMQDLLDEKITAEEAKNLIANAEEVRYTRVPRPDGIGEDERPCD